MSFFNAQPAIFRLNIGHRCKKGEALPGWEIRHISHPQLIRLSREELTLSDSGAAPATREQFVVVMKSRRLQTPRIRRLSKFMLPANLDSEDCLWVQST
jgi:hypothetical protein